MSFMSFDPTDNHSGFRTRSMVQVNSKIALQTRLGRHHRLGIMDLLPMAFRRYSSNSTAKRSSNLSSHDVTILLQINRREQKDFAAYARENFGTTRSQENFLTCLYAAYSMRHLV